jgi:nucleotide-binding universal stress UspA family protein
MFTKILVPLDGSEIAAKVLPAVVGLAKTFMAKVTLFHACYSGVGAFVGEATPATIEAAEAHEQKFCMTFMATAGENLRAQGVDADWVCQDGVPADQIIAFAQDNGYDLIVMGTHGTRDVAWYMGAVANSVAANTSVPVLLFRTLEYKPPLLREIYSQVPGENFPK